MIRNYGFVFLLLVSASLLTAAQTKDTTWVRRYDGPVAVDDVLKGMVVDGAGNTIVTGRSGGGGTEADCATVRYDGQGNVLWAARYNARGASTDWAQSLARDRQGNAILTGFSGFQPGYNVLTMKYSDQGTPLWVERYGGIYTTGEYGSLVTTDDSGNVGVAGYTFNAAGTNADWLTLKYDSDGNLLWAVTYGAPDGRDDRPQAIAFDRRGNVLVGGYVRNDQDIEDFALIKYDAAGNRRWLVTWDGNAAADMITAVLTDTAGNVYITGRSNNAPGMNGYPTFQTIKYDSTGRQVWEDNYVGPGNYASIPYALALDRSGNLFVTGGSTGSGSGLDYTTLKYRSSGSRAWVLRTNGTGNGDDAVDAIVLDTAGRMYLTGHSRSSAGNNDIVTKCYLDTVLQWSATYDGTGNSDDVGTVIGLDNALNVYVAGTSWGDTSLSDYVLIKYTGGAQVSGVEENLRPTPAGSFTVSPQPWPGSGEVAYTLGRAGRVSLELYGVTGARLLVQDLGTRKPGTYRDRLETGGIAPGIYVLRLNSAQGSSTRKLAIR